MVVTIVVKGVTIKKAEETCAMSGRPIRLDVSTSPHDHDKVLSSVLFDTLL